MNGLIEDIKQGDRAAFRELFEDYYPILCVFAMKYIRDEEQCKDVAQETLLTYWQNRADFEDIFKVKGYLYRVARNRCLNMIRREQVDEHFVKEALTESEAYFENEVIRQETYLFNERRSKAAISRNPKRSTAALGHGRCRGGMESLSCMTRRMSKKACLLNA